MKTARVYCGGVSRITWLRYGQGGSANLSVTAAACTNVVWVFGQIEREHRVDGAAMTSTGGPEEQSGRRTPPRRAEARRDVDAAEPAREQGYSAEVARQVADATTALGQRLVDPSVAHSVEEMERVVRGFAEAVHGMADGVNGTTEWLRASGHTGELSGHASVVSERMVHIGLELDRLAEAVQRARTEEPAAGAGTGTTDPARHE